MSGDWLYRHYTISSRFYWPRMSDDIENWIKWCQLCTMVKRGPRRQQASLQQELNKATFDRVTFDVIGPFPITANGKRFILTMIDYLSKWQRLMPFQTTMLKL